MIVTVGRHIKVETVRGLTFERTAKAPGMVTIKGCGLGQHIELPGFAEDAEQVIMAYRRVLSEDIEYRSQEYEGRPSRAEKMYEEWRNSKVNLNDAGLRPAYDWKSLQQDFPEEADMWLELAKL